MGGVGVSGGVGGVSVGGGVVSGGAAGPVSVGGTAESGVGVVVGTVSFFFLPNSPNRPILFSSFI